MAWVEERKDQYGIHYWIRFRIQGAKQPRLDGGYTEFTKQKAIKEAEGYESAGKGPNPETRITVAEAVQSYEDYAITLRLEPGTLQIRKQTLKYFKDKYGALSLGSITSDLIEKYIAFLRSYVTKKGKKKLTPDGINMKLRSLRALLNYCVDVREWLTKSPFKLAVADTHFQPAYLINGEIPKLIENCRFSKDLPKAVAVDLATGLREEELFNIEVRDVVEDFGFISVRKSKTHLQRFVPIFDSIRPIIQELCANKKPKDRLFDGWKTIGSMVQAIRRAVNRCEFGFRVRPHDLRHTFAALYLIGGGKLSDLSGILGHTSLAVTKKYYGKFSNIYMKEKYSQVKMAPLAMPKAENFQKDYVTVKRNGEWASIPKLEWQEEKDKKVA